MDSADLSYYPSLLGMPDLPTWLHYAFSPSVLTGFIYGAPPFHHASQNVKIEVIAKDVATYNISRQVLDLNIYNQPPKSKEVCLKVTNMNINEILVGERLRRLERVLVEDLWLASTPDGAITSLLSASAKGDRAPLDPHDKEGFYLCYGSSAPFSAALRELELEVQALWKHRPCPKYFKKTSYERYFRQKGFALDWCNFQLNTPKATEEKRIQTPDMETATISSLGSNAFKLRRRIDHTPRSYVFDVIYTILIPLLVMLVLLTLLTLAMCCHRANMDLQSSNFFDELFDDFPKMPTGKDMKMVRYAGINRASTALRSIRGQVKSNGRQSEEVDDHKTDESDEGENETEFHRHSPHELSLATNSTRMDTTLPRSRTCTPSRQFEDYATLTRPNPPPYQRNQHNNL